MAQSPAKSRPLSPHLQVYRPQITSVLSILHRIAGVALSGGAVWLVTWLYLAAKDSPGFETMRAFNASWLGALLLFGFAFCLYYHLCNGIRHLVWDAGYGYGLKTVTLSGWLAVAAAAALTVLSAIVAVAMTGAR
jgi:succinate dehydrogenase / fumarate reductase, cytochrome b subunit